MVLIVEPLSEEEQKKYSDMVVGKTTCICCHQEGIFVLNDNGRDGNSVFNYLENHQTEYHGDELCYGSEQRVAFLSDPGPYKLDGCSLPTSKRVNH